MKRLSFFILFLISIYSCTYKKALYAPVLLDYYLIYPDEARLKGLEGIVLVNVLVDELGRPQNIKLAKSSGIELLDFAALQTAKTFVFSPVMVGDEIRKSWVTVPVEFKFRIVEIEAYEWIGKVKNVQDEIRKSYQEEKVEELYNIYKELIYSPRKSLSINTNFYIKQATLKETEKLWEGFWSYYPAVVILFIDIINRFPDSFVSFEAWQDFREYIKEDTIEIKNYISSEVADSIVMRLRNVIKKQY
jgi:TonB family protein